MKLNISYLNGSGSNVRGKPALTLLFTALDEWIEHNVTVPQEIYISPYFAKLLAQENPYGTKYDNVISIIGGHRLLESQELGDYEIEFRVY